MNEQILTAIKNNPRINDFYSVGPVQRAAVEDFVDAVFSDLLEEANVANNKLKLLETDNAAIRKEMGVVMAEGQKQWRLKNNYMTQLLDVKRLINI